MRKKIFTVTILLLILSILLFLIFKNNNKPNVPNNPNIPINNKPKEENKIKLIERNNEGIISKNDLAKIGDTEEFYVIDTNNDKTTLIAKYNLYIGANYSKYDKKNEKYTLIKTISPNESGYGLQNKDAVGNISKDKETIGGVYFSSKPYWIDSNNKLLNKYGNNEDNTYGWLKNNIYDNNYKGYDDTNYSIAYYIELYLNKLGINNIEGRLLTQEELDKLGCHLNYSLVDCASAPNYLTNSSFYISSAYNDTFVYTNKYEIIPYNGNNRSPYYVGSYLEFDSEQIKYSLAGVRPVIEVNTKDIQ